MNHPKSLRRKPLNKLALASALACLATALQAQEQTAAAQLDPVEITGRHYDNAVGSTDAASQGVIRAELLKSRPALRPGEVLEFVPGVIVTQHSGDGKANQYFLRGFNLDHGTDFATRVDGMPVNMPTHGHGQGYTDLNFLIPELVERIDYRKGPYFAQQRRLLLRRLGRHRLPQHARRALRRSSRWARTATAAAWPAARSTLAPEHQLLGAVELQHNDGPWTVPEGLRKANAVLTPERRHRARRAGAPA